MDNTLINSLIENSLPIVGSTVSATVGAILSTLFIRHNSSISEFEKIKAGKFSELIDELLENGKMTYLEYYKCNNFLKIAKKADDFYENKNVNVNKEQNFNREIDFDWFIRFYDYASNTNCEIIQVIWAKILASEIQEPQSFSYSLLNSLYLMSKKQALDFSNISRFSLLDVDCKIAHPLIFMSSSYSTYEDSNITVESLKGLERLGLIECNFSNEYIFKNKKVFRVGNNVLTVYGDIENDKKIKAGNVIFTNDGQKLYSILDSDTKKYRASILDFIITKFQRRNCKVLLNQKEVE